MILGIITARGNSKSIPDKNIVKLGGIPLICYTLHETKKSKLDDYVLSTNDKKIAQYTDKVIYRPEHLCKDDTPHAPVLKHAMLEYEKTHGKVDAVMTLQPTSPFRLTEDINNAVDMYKGGSLVSVCKGIHPKKSYIDGKPCYEQTPYLKQKDKCYTRNSAIFITARDLIMHGKVYTDTPQFYIMPKTRSIDIDDYEDLMIAEYVLKGSELQ